MDNLEEQFPNSYELGQEREVMDCPCACGSEPKSETKKSKKKMEKYYPSSYIYNGPDGLAEDVRKLAKKAGDEGFYALIRIVPTRTSEEQITDKEGETKEKSSLDFEIREICLPTKVESDDSESEPADDSEAVDRIVSAAKSLGISVD